MFGKVALSPVLMVGKAVLDNAKGLGKVVLVKAGSAETYVEAVLQWKSVMFGKVVLDKALGKFVLVEARTVETVRKAVLEW